MKAKNSVFIATSLDGYIADSEGNIDWLHATPNPTNDDMGYREFIKGIDALVMGRVTYETVLGFGIDWPYKQPVFVLSSTLGTVPKDLEGKVIFVEGGLSEVIDSINERGYLSLYIDGGTTIQSFLKEDLIDEMIITRIPILLGGGFPLFGEMKDRLEFDTVSSKVFLDQITQTHYRRRRP